jgi:sulfite oxidase
MPQLIKRTVAYPMNCLYVYTQVDSAGNVQPRDMDHVWNLRGVNNTCWHRVKVKLKMPYVPCSSQIFLV